MMPMADALTYSYAYQQFQETLYLVPYYKIHHNQSLIDDIGVVGLWNYQTISKIVLVST